MLKSTTRYAEPVVTTVRAEVPYKDHEILLATTRLAHWASHNGIQLDHASVFSDSVIDGFIREGLPTHKDASRGTVRSQLRRVRDVLHGRPQPTAEVLSGADPATPYSADELATLSPWASQQKTPAFRRDARTILALGLGAGLSATQIGDVRREDVLDDDDGVQVRVTGERERTVQVRRFQEKRLRKAAAAVQPGEHLIRPGREGTARNFVTNLVDRGADSAHGPKTTRMRATWLVHHLNAGTPVGVLMNAAGLDSLKALTRYLEFTEPVAGDVGRRALRG